MQNSVTSQQRRPILIGRLRPLCQLIKQTASEAAAGGRKRIFLGLLTASCVVVCCFLFIFLIFPWLLSPISAWMAIISMGAGLTGIALLGWLCLTLVFHIYTGRYLPGISGVRHLCVRLFLPLMEMVGKTVGLDKTTVRRSFIKVNNELVCVSSPPVPAERLLVLLPHCIQAASCPRRLGPDLNRCVACGQCQIGELRKYAESIGIRIAIATGGTVARRIVAEIRPKQIIAVACERDLTSGIQDSYPIPVFGVLNSRPAGPCHDTVAPMRALENAIAFFLEK